MISERRIIITKLYECTKYMSIQELELDRCAKNLPWLHNGLTQRIAQIVQHTARNGTRGSTKRCITQVRESSRYSSSSSKHSINQTYTMTETSHWLRRYLSSNHIHVANQIEFHVHGVLISNTRKKQARSCKQLYERQRNSSVLTSAYSCRLTSSTRSTYESEQRAVISNKHYFWMIDQHIRTYTMLFLLIPTRLGRKNNCIFGIACV